MGSGHFLFPARPGSRRLGSAALPPKHSGAAGLRRPLAPFDHTAAPTRVPNAGRPLHQPRLLRKKPFRLRRAPLSPFRMSSRNRNRCTFTRDLPQLDFHKPLQAGPASVVLGGGVPSWPGSDSGGTRPHSMRCHDDKRLLPNSRSSCIAPACWLCRRARLRPETSHPTQALHKRQDGLLTRGHCPFEGRVPPGPAGNDSMQGPVPPGPRDAAEGVFHRTLWNASLQGRTAWKPSLHPEVRAVPSRVFSRAMLVQGRVPPRPGSHSGGTPPHSMRCRDLARPLRIREAFGVRQLAGAVEVRGGARRPTAPRLRYTYDRSF